VADFTYCSTWSGIVLRGFVVDLSRRIVGWKAARTMHTALVLDALDMADWTRRRTSIDGVACHSDPGSQPSTPRSPLPTASPRSTRPSIGAIGDILDALAETANGLFNAECVRLPDTAGCDDVDELELDDERGPHTGHLGVPRTGPHRLVAVCLSPSYVTATSLSSRRPSCWSTPVSRVL
jgi:putative transposase